MMQALPRVQNRSGGEETSAVVEINVALVAHDPDATLGGHAHHRRHVFGRERCAGGIVGEVQQQDLGPRRNSLFQHLRGDGKIVLLFALDKDTLAAGVLHHVLKRDPVGNGDDDFVAMVDEYLEEIEQGMFAADRGDHLFALVIAAEISRVAFDDGIAQLFDSADGGVLREISLNGCNRGILDVLGGGKVGLASRKVNQVNALCAQLVAFGNRRQRGRRFNPVDPVGEWRYYVQNSQP